MKQYYVLFKNHDNGMRLYNSLKSKNIKATIAPTPRVASKSCGISLLINKDDIEKIREIVTSEEIDIIDIVEIDKNINQNRDKYC
ncbi:DUF3343 domain-containing protein [Intestinibacter bartlettii]|uniref:Putative Se/S carrier protein-like domain-containing protein n=1 Tax=Intestinibacter bartlettii CAG:1329 TaxID=1263063 RepID=R5X5T4_9FIRM|nr:DUF3343 domain-containing protein [Intestinibacter bartlettii]CDA11003.1 uncharacterized protein BN488_02030 [Intestinibacter bartlettii CAG:1329]